jgi:hypothetical protein
MKQGRTVVPHTGAVAAGQHFATALRAEAVACLRGFDCAVALGLVVLTFGLVAFLRVAVAQVKHSVARCRRQVADLLKREREQVRRTVRLEVRANHLRAVTVIQDARQPAPVKTRERVLAAVNGDSEQDGTQARQQHPAGEELPEQGHARFPQRWQAM